MSNIVLCNRKLGWARGALLLLLAVVVIGSRFLALTADPPTDMVLDYLFDEGWWSHNARLHTVFGQWIMDEHNMGLFWAPLYTGTLSVIYNLAGCGLWQTRSLAALAGVSTCFMVYGFVRASHGERAALFATLLLSSNYLWLTYNRVAFVESFQVAFISLAYLSAAAATRRRAWIVLAGMAYALAVMAKISALTSLAGIGVFWAWQFIWPDRNIDVRRQRQDTLTAILWFAVTVGSIGFLVWLFLIHPHLDVFVPATKHLVGLADGHSSAKGLFTLGLKRALLAEHVIPSTFVTQNVLLLACVALVAFCQLSIARPRLDVTGRLCWCWFVFCCLSIGAKEFDADRRYLQLLPPLAILLGTELARSGLTIAAREELVGRSARYRRWASCSVVAVALGFVVRAPLVNVLLQLDLGRNWQLGHQHGLGHAAWAGLAWGIIFVVATPLLCWLVRCLPTRRVQVPVWLILILVIGLDLTKTGVYVSRLTYYLQDAIHQVSDIGHRLPPASRVIVGDTADTLGMESDCFTFVIRDWPQLKTYMNLDGWERFSPSIALPEEVPEGFVRVADLTVAPARPGKTPTVIPLCVRETLQGSVMSRDIEDAGGPREAK